MPTHGLFTKWATRVRQSVAIVAGVVTLAGMLSPAAGADFQWVPQWGYGLTDTGDPDVVAMRNAIQHSLNRWNAWLASTVSGPSGTRTVEFALYDFGEEDTLAWAYEPEWEFDNKLALTPSQYMVSSGDDPAGYDYVDLNSNSAITWHMDPSTPASSNDTDAVSVVLHEVGHLLGIFDTYNPDENTWGEYDPQTRKSYLSQWDSYLRDYRGHLPSVRMPDEFDRTGSITFVGPQATAANGGPVSIEPEDPSEPNPGSMLCHVAEDSPLGEALMSPYYEETVRGLTLTEMGIFQDLGWTFAAAPTAQAVGGKDYNWHNGAAWDFGLPPTSPTAVTIATPYTITVTKQAAAASVTINDGSLTIASAKLQTGTFSMSGGAVAINSGAELKVTGHSTLRTLTNRGVLRLQSGTLLGGSLANYGTAYLGGAVCVNNTGGIAAAGGVFRLEGGSLLPCDSNGVLINGNAQTLVSGWGGLRGIHLTGGGVTASGGDLVFQDGGAGSSWNVDGNMLVENSARLALEAGGTLGGVLTNQGRLDFGPGGTVSIGGLCHNQGSAWVPITAGISCLGGYQQSTGGTLELQASATNHSRLHVAGSVDLNGMLTVTTLDNFRPQQEGDTFTIIQGLDPNTAAYSGDFASITSNITLGLQPGLDAFSGTVEDSDYVLVFQGLTAGDANGDHVVNAGDLSLMGGGWLKSGQSWSMADFNGDGVVNAGDLALMGGNWLWSRPASAPGEAELPEPATSMLMALGGLTLVRRRRESNPRRVPGQ